MYEEFKNDDGKTVDEEFGNDVRPALVPVIHKIEQSLESFVKTGYLHQYEYIEDKYPETIRIEKEEDGSEVEVMDLLFFYDRKKLDEEAIRQRINFFASETKCEVRVVVIKIDDASQQEKN